jgi:hypothetical protein
VAERPPVCVWPDGPGRSRSFPEDVVARLARVAAGGTGAEVACASVAEAGAPLAGGVGRRTAVDRTEVRAHLSVSNPFPRISTLVPNVHHSFTGSDGCAPTLRCAPSGRRRRRTHLPSLMEVAQSATTLPSGHGSPTSRESENAAERPAEADNGNEA